MRTHRHLVIYESILQTLNEPGCPFCRFLKEFQAARLQSPKDVEIHHVCNFHAWGLAAVRDAPAAAEVFLGLVGEPTPSSSDNAACDICVEVMAEEDLRIREFVSCVDRAEVLHWLKANAVLCISHGMKLRRKLPLILTPRIDAIISGYRQQLTSELMQLREEKQPDRVGWGALGRAAEFLISQRGLRA
jgi:hypothetical protein